MIIEFIISLVALIAAVRTTGYGIYTWTDENYVGAVGLFVIAAACVVICAIVVYFILTNA